MSALVRAETEWTQFRGDGTVPGIGATIEDGVGRKLGFWMASAGWGHSGKTVGVYLNGRNHQTTFAVSLTVDETRRLATSLLAMADAIKAQESP